MFELHYFGEILCLEFKDNPDPLSAPCENYDDWIQDLPFEVTIMQQAMQQTATQLRQKDVRKYVSDHQAGIVNYADQYRQILGDEFTDMNNITEENTRLNLAKRHYRALEEMLAFIQNYFFRYFDMDAYIFQAHREMAVKEIEPKLEILRSKLEEHEVRRELLDIAFKPLTEFTETTKPITFRHLLYLQDLLQDISLTLNGEKAMSPEDQLFNALCSLNFNSIDFKNYIKKRCAQKINTGETREARLITLRLLTDKCRNFEIQTDVALRPEAEHLKPAILSWMENAKESINVIADLSIQKGETEKRYKLPFSLTGSEMGLLTRVLVQTKIITEPVKVRIFRFIAENYLVENEFDISVDTIDSRYNSPSMATKNSLSRILKKLEKAIAEV